MAVFVQVENVRQYDYILFSHKEVIIDSILKIRKNRRLQSSKFSIVKTNTITKFITNQNRYLKDKASDTV